MTARLAALLFALTLLASPALLTAAGQADVEGLHPDELRFTELRFEPAEPRRMVTRQGITLILLEDHELPLVQFSGKLRAGNHLDPPDKLGLAELTAKVARIGGAGRFGPDELDEELEFVAASVELSVGREPTDVSASCLARDLDLLLEALAAILVKPRFDGEKLELQRGKMIEAVRRINDDPGQIAREELYKVIYGPEDPWGRRPTVETLRAIERQDLVDFHRRYWSPEGLILGVAGDFEAEDLARRIEEAFASWPAVPPPPLAKPSDEEPRPGVFLVEKDLAQSTIRMGHMGLERLNPDYPACLVMNRILGIGTFTSRMGKEIRSNRGLAYSVASGLFEGNGPGPFIALATTKAGSTHEVVGLMRDIIAGMGRGDISEEELELAKQTLLNTWIFEFEDPAEIVSTRVEHEFYGYPADYLKEYPERIAAVTAADVVRCARQYLRPDELSVFVVGDPDRFGQPLEELGPVTRVELPEYD